MKNLDLVARKVRQRIMERFSITSGDIVKVNGQYGKVLKTTKDWVQLKIGNKEKIVNSSSVRILTDIESMAYKYAQKMPLFVVNYVRDHPEDKNNANYEGFWDDVVNKLGSKFGYGAGVAYWRNKCVKNLGALPKELAKKVEQVPKPAVPLIPGEQVEEWMNAESITKDVITKYMQTRQNLENQLDAAKSKLSQLGPLEEKIQPLLREMKDQMFQVGNTVLRYEKSNKTSKSYANAFSKALLHIDEEEREFIKAQILSEVTNRNTIEKLKLEIKSNKKESGVIMDFIKNILSKFAGWLSGYRRSVMNFKKLVG